MFDHFNRWQQYTPYIGDFFEEFAAKLLRGEKVKHDGGRMDTPDLAIDEHETWVEVKGFNSKHGGPLIYEHQISDYSKLLTAPFSYNNPSLVYALIEYRAEKVTDAKSSSELLDNLVSSVKRAWIFDIQVMADYLVKDRPWRYFEIRRGWSRATNIPLTKIRQMANGWGDLRELDSSKFQNKSCLHTIKMYSMPVEVECTCVLRSLDVVDHLGE